MQKGVREHSGEKASRHSHARGISAKLNQKVPCDLPHPLLVMEEGGCFFLLGTERRPK